MIKKTKEEIILGISTFWDLSGIALEEDDINSKNSGLLSHITKKIM